MKTALKRVERDLTANNLDFQSTYRHAQAWAPSIRQQSAFQPLNERERMTPRPFVLLTLQNEIEDLLEALLAQDIDGTRTACAAALKSIP